MLAESSNHYPRFKDYETMIQIQILYNHRNCKNETFNASKTSSRKRTTETSLEREESRKNKQHLCTVWDSKVLPYKDKFILYYELVCLYDCNPTKEKEKHSLDQTIRLLTD